MTKMLEGEAEKLVRMDAALKEKVIGQDSAVELVANAIRRNRAGLSDPDRPIGSFIFLGPTGVGKTELARVLAEFLFDSRKAMVRIDMSEYMEKHAVSRMIGAPPGYVGHEEGGQLTEHVRRSPYSVILLDEVEKAHPEVFNILLQVLEDGRLTDGKGRTVSFANSVIVMTSNVGSQEILKNASIGFSLNDRGGSRNADMRRDLLDALGRKFRPEFLNRIDDIIVFNSLDRKHLESIVELQLVRVSSLLAGKRIRMEVTPEAKELIVSRGHDRQFGARPMKRADPATDPGPSRAGGSGRTVCRERHCARGARRRQDALRPGQRIRSRRGGSRGLRPAPAGIGFGVDQRAVSLRKTPSPRSTPIAPIQGIVKLYQAGDLAISPASKKVRSAATLPSGICAGAAPSWAIATATPRTSTSPASTRAGTCFSCLATAVATSPPAMAAINPDTRFNTLQRVLRFRAFRPEGSFAPQNRPHDYHADEDDYDHRHVADNDPKPNAQNLHPRVLRQSRCPSWRCDRLSIPSGLRTVFRAPWRDAPVDTMAVCRMRSGPGHSRLRPAMHCWPRTRCLSAPMWWWWVPAWWASARRYRCVGGASARSWWWTGDRSAGESTGASAGGLWSGHECLTLASPDIARKARAICTPTCFEEFSLRLRAKGCAQAHRRRRHGAGP